MNENELKELWISLHEVLDKWLDDNDQISRPYLGEDTVGCMVDACLNIMIALEDVQNSLRADGMLSDVSTDSNPPDES